LTIAADASILLTK